MKSAVSCTYKHIDKNITHSIIVLAASNNVRSISVRYIPNQQHHPILFSSSAESICRLTVPHPKRNYVDVLLADCY